MKNIIYWVQKNTYYYIFYRCNEVVRITIGTFISSLIFKIRCFYLRIPYGKNLEVYGFVNIRCPGGGITIGNDVQLISSSWRCTASTLTAPVRLRTIDPGAYIYLGDKCGLNGTSLTCRSTSITISPGVMFGPNCIVMDSDFHAIWPIEQRKLSPGYEGDDKVFIGENVWVGANSIILKGVSIGENSVIGAGSVVTKSFPANALIAGNPAKLIKYYV
jgi:acetyltransferase-like isoleucine patch superfamily enzyme